MSIKYVHYACIIVSIWGCGKTNGICIKGCTPGQHGDTCDETCSHGCVGGTCDQQKGTCSAGCKQNWTGRLCDGRYFDAKFIYDLTVSTPVLKFFKTLLLHVILKQTYEIECTYLSMTHYSFCYIHMFLKPLFCGG